MDAEVFADTQSVMVDQVGTMTTRSRDPQVDLAEVLRRSVEQAVRGPSVRRRRHHLVDQWRSAVRAGARQLIVGGAAGLIVFGIGNLISHSVS